MISDGDSYSSTSSGAVMNEEPLLSLLERLEQEIGNNVHLDVDLARFAHEVWGLDEDTIGKLLSTSTTLDDIQLQDYKRCSNEDKVLEKFQVISKHFLKRSIDEIGEHDSDTLPKTFWVCPPSQNLTNTTLAPASLLDHTSTHSLAVAKSLIEFKFLSSEPTDEDGEEGWTPSTQSMGTAKTNTHSSVLPTKQSTAAIKRCFDSVRDAEDEYSVASKRQRRMPKQPLRDSLLPLYAMKALSLTGRYYVVGMLVNRFELTVCYFDHFLVACVASFSFEEEPSKLALVLYAMNQCEHHRAGFNPHLINPPAQTADGKAGEAESLDSVIGLCFEYPSKTAPDAPSTLDIDASARICVRVTEVIRRPEQLIGRATSVYKVRQRLPDGTFSQEECVHKISWPPKNSVSEIDVVKTLNERLPEEAHDHIPQFSFTSTSSAEELALPWLRLGLNLSDVNYHDRVLRAMTGKLYHKIWEAGSIDNFKRAWLDCVECLYLAYKCGRVLHRDISEDNIMVSKLSDGTVKGVLYDWDMAKFIDDGVIDLSTPENGAGTPPFMALELVNRRPMRHYLRHDLESFFYVLIWAALHYNLATSQRDRHLNPSVVAWTLDAGENALGKAGILTLDSLLTERIYASVKPEFAELVQEWIEPLRVLFISAQMSHHLDIYARKPSDEETLGGRLTFETFMKSIKATPRTWGSPKSRAQWA